MKMCGATTMLETAELLIYIFKDLEENWTGETRYSPCTKLDTS